MKAARTGALDTDAGVKTEVARLMASPRLETGMRGFFSDFLQLDTLARSPRTRPSIPNTATRCGFRARRNLAHHHEPGLKNNGDFRELFTTRKTFINRPLAWVYDVPYNLDGDWMPYEFHDGVGPQRHRHPGFDASMFSHPGRSSPTKRGVALMDIFLCEPTPTPPANVDFSIVNDVNNPKLRTVRDRLKAHATTPTCASCHTHSDPIG